MSVLDHPWPPPLSGDSSLSEVIAEFLEAAEPGARRRELRAAISHVDAELGTMRIRAVRSRHVEALLAGLRRAGLSSRREAALVEALHSLFSYAVARRLVADDPVGTGQRVRDAARPARTPRSAPPPPSPARTPSLTPTLTMLAVGARVALWTTWLVALGFVVMLLVLVVELA